MWVCTNPTWVPTLVLMFCRSWCNHYVHIVQTLISLLSRVHDCVSVYPCAMHTKGRNQHQAFSLSLSILFFETEPLTDPGNQCPS